MIVLLLAKITNQTTVKITSEIRIQGFVSTIAQQCLKILLLEIVFLNAPQVIGATQEIILVTNNVLMANMAIRLQLRELVTPPLIFPDLLLGCLVILNQGNTSVSVQLPLNFIMEIGY